MDHTTTSTRCQLIQHAQRLIQSRGYNGFSYRDLAELVGIKTASIHYYFPQKEDLLLAAIDDYSARWHQNVFGMPDTLSAAQKLQRYFDLHAQAIESDKGVCLGGALAADLMLLPASVRHRLQDFYQANESWLAHVLELGARDGSWPAPPDPQSAARTLYAAVQGSLISARLFSNTSRLSDPLIAMKNAANNAHVVHAAHSATA